MNITHYERFAGVYIAYGASNKPVGLLRTVGRVNTRGNDSNSLKRRLDSYERKMRKTTSF